jgi:N-hydroxyarylamine O-acetyltransferase
LLEPIALTAGESRQFEWTYRLAREGDTWALAAPQAGQWLDLYEFTREPHLQVDFEPGNYYVSHQPDSIFVQSLTAQRPTPTARHVLRNREYIVAGPDGSTSRVIQTDNELIDVLGSEFGLRVSAGPWLSKVKSPTTA